MIIIYNLYAFRYKFFIIWEGCLNHIYTCACALSLSPPLSLSHTHTHTHTHTQYIYIYIYIYIKPLGPAVNFRNEQNLLACHRFVSFGTYGHGGDDSPEGQAHDFVC